MADRTPHHSTSGNLASPEQSSDRSNRRQVLSYLASAGYALILTPVSFWIRYREVGPLGWGLTVFLTAICLLVAVGLHFGPTTRPAMQAQGGWLDRLGSGWLLVCAFGPLAGWVVTDTMIPVTHASWRWLYGARVFLAVLLPVITMLPLLRYARGKTAPLALAILVGVTLLPILSGAAHLGDFLAGPVTQVVELDTPGGPACVPAGGRILVIPCEEALWQAGSARVRASAFLFTGRLLTVEAAP